jgi:molecular chaperone GrpE
MNEPFLTPEEAGDDQFSPEESTGELAALAAERDKYLDLARRTQADFENYQKRVRRDIEAERRFAILPIAVDLLPVLDNLERALAAVAPESVEQQLAEGIRLVRKQWLDVFDKYDVRPIQADGQPFDPNQHEAVMQQPSPDLPPMSVLTTVRSGYTLHERVLRPAQVIVSAPAS